MFVGALNGLDSSYWIHENYALRLKTYFTAPMSGYYVFVAACDDKCRIYLSPNENEADKKLIIDAGWARHYEWDRYVMLRS